MREEIKKEVQAAELNLEELDKVSGGEGTEVTEWTCPRCGKKITGPFLKVQVLAHQQQHSEPYIRK